MSFGRTAFVVLSGVDGPSGGSDLLEESIDAFRRDCAERARQGRWTVAPPGLPARTASPDRRRARSSLVIASDTFRGGHVEPLDLARYAAAGQAAQASDAPDAPVHSYLPPELATR
jgi:hypothetical protein